MDTTYMKDGVRYEKCVSGDCGKKLDIRFDTHVDMRPHYVPGFGQLCDECYQKVVD